MLRVHDTCNSRPLMLRTIIVIVAPYVGVHLFRRVCAGGSGPAEILRFPLLPILCKERGSHSRWSSVFRETVSSCNEGLKQFRRRGVMWLLVSAVIRIIAVLSFPAKVDCFEKRFTSITQVFSSTVCTRKEVCSLSIRVKSGCEGWSVLSMGSSYIPVLELELRGVRSKLAFYLAQFQLWSC